MTTLLASMLNVQQKTLLATVTAGLFLLVTSILCYRLTLHPLARYPGQLLARLTEWATVYQTSTGDRHIDQLGAHRQYGSIVRIGPNTLSFNTIGAVKEIYTNRQAHVRKAPWYTVIEASAGNERSLHAEIDREVHAAHRRVMEHAFTDKSLRASEHFIVKNVQTFCDIVSQGSKSDNGWSKPFNMSQWSTYLNYDIMGDLVFGRRFNVMVNDEHRSVPRLLMNSTAFIYTYASIPLKALSRRLLASGVLSLSVIGGQMARDDRKFYEYAERVLEDRMAVEEKCGETRKDIMYHLLRATDPVTGQGFSREQLKVESSLLIAAGADTTSLTLAAALFYLMHNSRAMENLTKEVEEMLSSESGQGETSPSKLIGLPYLRAVIDETLRLSPPVPSSLPREVLNGGITIDGHQFPEGTLVGVPAYVIHRNPTYFPEPEVFYPERWIVRDSDRPEVPDFPDIPRTRDSVALARQAFVAFSQGPRGCIGRQLAYYELHTALALILRRFDIRLARDPATQRQLSDSVDWRDGLMTLPRPEESQLREERRIAWEFQLFDRFLSDRNGPMVEFKDKLGG